MTTSTGWISTRITNITMNYFKELRIFLTDGFERFSSLFGLSTKFALKFMIDLEFRNKFKIEDLLDRLKIHMS